MHTHPEAQQYADATPELERAAEPITNATIRAEFPDGLIAAFLLDSGYSSLSDIRRDYSATDVRSMLARFEQETRP